MCQTFILLFYCLICKGKNKESVNLLEHAEVYVLVRKSKLLNRLHSSLNIMTFYLKFGNPAAV